MRYWVTAGFLFLVLFSTATAHTKLEIAGVEALPSVLLDGEKVKVHTQGLFVTDQHFLVTGRLEKSPKRSWLIRFHRGSDRYEVLDITQFIDGTTLDHPGGFDQDDTGLFWIPISTSHRRGPTSVCGYRIDPKKALSKAKIERRFTIKDHVGAICCRGDNALLTANWDTKLIAAYKPDGTNVFEIKQEKTLLHGKPHIAVQDWKRFTHSESSKLAIIGGLNKESKDKRAMVLIADMFDGSVIEEFHFESPESVSRPVTNEGMHFHDMSLYLLPEDIGKGAKVLRYKLEMSAFKTRSTK